MTDRLLLVTGAGRSGTSTVAGALHRLGLHVPQPEVEADETNPRGFFESQWVVDFHKELLRRAPVRTIDSRPEAGRLAAETAADPDARVRLRAWLEGLSEHQQLLIKDPRAFWMHELWRVAAADTGRELGFLTMLRHPAEVAKSRDSAYLSEETDEFRRRRATANVAAWCNAAFETELASRGVRRAMVRYADLLADWRQTLRRAGDVLGLDLDADLTGDDPHPIDDFIDPVLHRLRVSWTDVDLPDELRAVAERTWGAMNLLVDAPEDHAAVEELESARADYVRLHDYAVAIALDHTHVREIHVRRRVTARLRNESVTGAPKAPRWGRRSRGSR